MLEGLGLGQIEIFSPLAILSVLYILLKQNIYRLNIFSEDMGCGRQWLVRRKFFFL